MPSMSSALRIAWIALAVGAAAAAGCARDDGDGSGAQARAPAEALLDATGNVTISGDDSQAVSLTWQVPEVDLEDADLEELRARAAAAMDAGHLYEDADAAIPIYLALADQPGHARVVEAGLRRALRLLLQQGDAALAAAGETPESMVR